MIDLTDKVALISGGARGQGAAEARLFSQLGASVVVGDIVDDEGRALVEDIGPPARYVHLDVTSGDSWREAVAATVGRHGRLDVLVNNAGIAGSGMRLEDLDEDLYRQTIDVNQVGVLLGMHHSIPAMRDSGGGSIVNIASTAANRGVLASIAYSSSKWAVRGMTKTAAIELGPYGIRVNSVHPGVIDTQMVGWDRFDDATRNEIVGDLPLPRIGTPEEVAIMVAFLASDASSYSTGGEFMVDGGSLAGRSLFADANEKR